MLTLHDYQTQALTTAIYPTSQKITYPALGLVGEAGEVANKVKKMLRDRGGRVTLDDVFHIADELGDVLWYVATLAADLGVSLDCIAQKNLRKLQDRAARGTLGGSGDDR